MKTFRNLSTLALILTSTSLVSLTGCEAKDTTEPKKEAVVVDIMSDYGAHGDGVNSDRAIIQKAINELSLQGGGKIVFTKGHTFLTGNLILRSDIELYIDDGAILLQNGDVHDYVEVRGYDYGNGFVKIGDPIIPFTGDVFIPNTGEYENLWPECPDYREAWHWNYPWLYADKGTNNIKISGGENSKINFAPHGTSCEGKIHSNGFGFYRVTNFEISNLEINYNGQHLFDLHCCNNGLISHLDCRTVRSTGGDECHLNDGLHIEKCQDMLIEYCTFAAGDDALLLGNSYGDLRRDRWLSACDTQVMKNIEISHVTCPSYCSGFAFLSLCGTCPNIEEVEMRDIYIHDCNFAGVKEWGQNTVWLPDRSMWNGINMPISNLRWERNNAYFAPEGYTHQLCGYFNRIDHVSDLISDAEEMNSMRELQNGDFVNGKSYWNFKETNGSISTVQTQGEERYGYIGELSKGKTSIYEGLYLETGTYKISAKVRNSTMAEIYLFVSDQQDNIISQKDARSISWENKTLTFEITQAGNYRLGLTNGANCRDGSWAMLDNFALTKIL